MCPWPPCCRWIRQVSDSRWPPSYLWPWRIPLPWKHSSGLRPIYSWSVPVSRPALTPGPAGPKSVRRFTRSCPLPPCHQHTMARWQEGVRTIALGWEGVPICHIQSWIRSRTFLKRSKMSVILYAPNACQAFMKLHERASCFLTLCLQNVSIFSWTPVLYPRPNMFVQSYIGDLCCTMM